MASITAAPTAIVQATVERKVKDQATTILAELGLTVDGRSADASGSGSQCERGFLLAMRPADPNMPGAPPWNEIGEGKCALPPTMTGFGLRSKRPCARRTIRTRSGFPTRKPVEGWCNFAPSAKNEPQKAQKSDRCLVGASHRQSYRSAPLYPSGKPLRRRAHGAGDRSPDSPFGPISWDWTFGAHPRNERDCHRPNALHCDLPHPFRDCRDSAALARCAAIPVVGALAFHRTLQHPAVCSAFTAAPTTRVSWSSFTISIE